MLAELSARTAYDKTAHASLFLCQLLGKKSPHLGGIDVRCNGVLTRRAEPKRTVDTVYYITSEKIA
jgi:hypothetical protein